MEGREAVILAALAGAVAWRLGWKTGAGRMASAAMGRQAGVWPTIKSRVERALAPEPQVMTAEQFAEHMAAQTPANGDTPDAVQDVPRGRYL
jgi:hypothetical protein